MKDEKKCERCGGTGEIDWGIVAPPNFIPPSKTTPCEDCNGSGVQPEEKQDEIREAFEEWESDHGHDKKAWAFRIETKDIHSLGFYGGYKSASEPRDKRIKELEDGYLSYRSAYCKAEAERLELEERLEVAEYALNRVTKGLDNDIEAGKKYITNTALYQSLKYLVAVGKEALSKIRGTE